MNSTDQTRTDMKKALSIGEGLSHFAEPVLTFRLLT